MAKYIHVDPIKLGQYIKKKREELGITKYNLALQLRISPSTVTRWEHGECSTIRSDLVIKMAAILGVTADTIFQGGYADDGEALEAISNLRERKELRLTALAPGLTDEQLEVVLIEVGALVRENTRARNNEMKAARDQEKERQKAAQE